VDTLVAAIIKRLSQGRRDGVALVAEGAVLDIDPQDLAGIQDVERDAHGNIRPRSTSPRRSSPGR
jgi:ATP-dependent phosphofructokinase / diphosphate-dependent phosphofructokinase